MNGFMMINRKRRSVKLVFTLLALLIFVLQTGMAQDKADPKAVKKPADLKTPVAPPKAVPALGSKEKTPPDAEIDAHDALVHQVFSPKEMKEQWAKFGDDKDWKALMNDVESKGFTRILNDEMSWGFHGTLGKGKDIADVKFCAFDFINSKDVSQGCTAIWGNIGDKSYKAYMIFPAGEKDAEKKMANAQEWYVENGKVLKANSFGSRFRACVQRGNEAPGIETELSNNRSRIKIGGSTYIITCQTQCFASAVACSTLAAGTAIITAGVIAASGGTLTIPALIAAGGFGAAVLIGCSAAGCGTCIFMCALAAI